MENKDRPANPTNGRMHSEMTGLTKRELFAMAAMQGIVSSQNPLSKNEIAVHAVYYADALLKALEDDK